MSGGQYALPEVGTIVLDVPRPADFFFTARRMQAALREQAGVQLGDRRGRLARAITDHAG